MTEASAAKKFLRSTLATAGVSLAVVAGFAAAPSLLQHNQAQAQEIVIAPPAGAPMSFANLIERVRPAVVSVSVRQNPSAAQGQVPEGLPPGLEDYFRNRPGRPGPAPMALGSGFFIDERGTIVTNHHVIEDAAEIKIKTSDGRELPVDIVGSDEATDIAVLRVRGGGRFQYVTFDTDADVRVGDWVVAVGNPFGLEGTATAGIVSATGRRDAGNSAYVDYMQIDAPINQGNSGGPTFDLRGRVIGVNTLIYSPTGGNVGIGFAIPSQTAAAVVQQLAQGGRVSRGWLGVSVQPLDEDIAHSLGLSEAKGALVAAVTPNSPAARGGVMQGDVILHFNGQEVNDSRDLTQRVGSTRTGSTVRLDVLRGGQRRNLNVQLAERPSEQQLASAEGGQQGGATPTPPPSASTLGPLGVTVRALTAEDRARYELRQSESGVVIVNLDPNGDLSNKGVRPGDLILQAGGAAMRTPADLEGAVTAARRANRPLLLQVQGRGGRRFVAAELAHQ
jgi:serine protease Do